MTRDRARPRIGVLLAAMDAVLDAVLDAVPDVHDAPRSAARRRGVTVAGHAAMSVTGESRAWWCGVKQVPGSDSGAGVSADSGPPRAKAPAPTHPPTHPPAGRTGQPIAVRAFLGLLAHSLPLSFSLCRWGKIQLIAERSAKPRT